MTFPLDPEAAVIILPITVCHNQHTLLLRMVLDTGATLTLIRPGIAKALELDLESSFHQQVTTTAGVIFAPLIKLPEVTVFNVTQRLVPAIVAELPEEAGVDGLLGLSFLKQCRVTIDYKAKSLSLT